MQININTRGSYLHIKDEMFEIKVKCDDGSVKKYNYSSKKVSSIILGQGVALSTDAVKIAVKNNIDIIFTEYDGFPIGRVWHSKLGSTTRIRKKQLEASLNEIGLKWIKLWILQKVLNQMEFLEDLKKHRSDKLTFLNDKIINISSLKNSLELIEGTNVKDVADTIHGLEGTAGRIYFETLSMLLSDEYKFNGRSSRPALDQFNAFLNYAYGVLYGRVEKALIIAGVDPYLGFLHRDDYNQLSMVFDFIEQYRIFSDRVVFRLFSGKKVNQSHTDRMNNGFILNNEGKKLLMENYNKYLEDDPIRYKGRNITRSNIIQFDAHSFANSLIGKNDSLGDV